MKSILLFLASLLPALLTELCAAEPLIRQLRGPDGTATVEYAVYPPEPSSEGRGGLVVHLYGAGGSNKPGHFNIGRPP